MTDLELLRAEPVPRSKALCRRFALRIDSIGGFIAYGLLWFFVACGAATAALFAGIAIVGKSPGPVGAALVIFAWVGAFIGAWVVFGWWVRQRLGPAKRLFREGVLVDATVVSVRHMHMRGAPFTYATLRVSAGVHERSAGLSIGGHPAEITNGATIPVLFVPDYSYCAAFPVGGRIVATALGKPTT